MKKKLSVILIVVCLFSLSCVYATGSGGTADYDTVINKITEILALIAGFVCLGKLIQIGIMYILSGANDKSQAKTAVLPWAVGTVICGGYVFIHKRVVEIFGGEDAPGVFDDVDPAGPVGDIGNTVLNYLQVFAWSAAVGVLIFIGIKYMMAGAGEKATVKRTVMPWLIGIIVVALATTIASVVLEWGQRIA